MKVIANETLRNGYSQVLFIAGREYEAEKVGNRFKVFNELHTETPMARSEFSRRFRIEA